MLSKKELEFLLKGGTGNSDYDRVMKHRIRAKLLKFKHEVLPALKLNDWSKRWLLCALLSVTENCNALQDPVTSGENRKSVLNVPFTEKSNIRVECGAAGWIRTRAAGLGSLSPLAALGFNQAGPRPRENILPRG